MPPNNCDACFNPIGQDEQYIKVTENITPGMGDMEKVMYYCMNCATIKNADNQES